MVNSQLNEKYLSGIISLLVLLWIYTAFSKLSEFTEFVDQLKNQVFPKQWVQILSWSLPTIEVGTSGLLLFARTRRLGLWLSLILMILFTLYITLVLIGTFERTPCSCGGILKELGWKSHLLFNLFFLSISVIGLRLEAKERRIAVTS